MPDRPEFERMYAQAEAAWEIGRPQPEVMRIADAGGFGGEVLDAGCGTGANAIWLAARGLSVLGIDFVPAAIDSARAAAAARGSTAKFEVLSALELETLGRTFDTVLDSGMFHAFPDGPRARYVEAVSAVTRPGARLHIICFSEHEPGQQGPRRVTQAELRSAFSNKWRETEMVATRYEVAARPGANRYSTGGALAWRATFERV